ncbi:hypothetical protein F6X42_17445 [Paraburkholderia sp. WC7.3b]|uniref:Transposase n=1 Tax=Paraburkholderia podalyriae TaxID=1938811 RepID=A0ABR7PPY7_9BURK|nr:hypothetical protein [Paraburkholderia podalyriae]
MRNACTGRRTRRIAPRCSSTTRSRTNRGSWFIARRFNARRCVKALAAARSGPTRRSHRRKHDELELTVDRYATQKCHPTDARQWLLLAVDVTHHSWRVKRRLP